MTDISAEIAAIIQNCRGRDLDAHYLAFFECFNRQWFFEAHEVLEKIWLPARRGPDDKFYKGLIQLAGAFVHVQKKRANPAVSLFKLARANLAKYPGVHHRLDLGVVVNLADEWIADLASGSVELSGFPPGYAPRLVLLAPR